MERLQRTERQINRMLVKVVTVAATSAHEAGVPWPQIFFNVADGLERAKRNSVDGVDAATKHASQQITLNAQKAAK